MVSKNRRNMNNGLFNEKNKRSTQMYKTKEEEKY